MIFSEFKVPSLFACTIAANPAREFTQPGSALHSGLSLSATNIGPAHAAMFSAFMVDMLRLSPSVFICPVSAAP